MKRRTLPVASREIPPAPLRNVPRNLEIEAGCSKFLHRAARESGRSAPPTPVMLELLAAILILSSSSSPAAAGMCDRVTEITIFCPNIDA